MSTDDKNPTSANTEKDTTDKQDDELTIIIQSPRGRTELTFHKTTKVADVVEKARVAFGFEPGAFVLKQGDTVLAPKRSLVSYHIKDGDVLLLIPEMGSGV